MDEILGYCLFFFIVGTFAVLIVGGTIEGCNSIVDDYRRVETAFVDTYEKDNAVKIYVSKDVTYELKYSDAKSFANELILTARDCGYSIDGDYSYKINESQGKSSIQVMTVKRTELSYEEIIFNNEEKIRYEKSIKIIFPDKKLIYISPNAAYALGRKTLDITSNK